MEAVMADLDRNAIPANADCRGGVFATRRFPRPLYSPYAKIPRRLRRANPPHPSNQPYAHTIPSSPNIPISDGLSRLESLKIGIPSTRLFLQDGYAID